MFFFFFLSTCWGKAGDAGVIRGEGAVMTDVWDEADEDGGGGDNGDDDDDDYFP